MNAWPGGSTIEVAGTYTKTVSDGVGIIEITLPTDDDEVVLMYGQIATQTHAGGSDIVYYGIRGATGVEILYCATVMDANQKLYIPFAEADAGIAVGNNTHTRTIYQNMISGTDKIRVSVDDMKFATSETFTFRAKFRSRSGAALTVTPSGGTWG